MQILSSFSCYSFFIACFTGIFFYRPSLRPLFLLLYLFSFSPSFVIFYCGFLHLLSFVSACTFHIPFLIFVNFLHLYLSASLSSHSLHISHFLRKFSLRLHFPFTLPSSSSSYTTPSFPSASLSSHSFWPFFLFPFTYLSLSFLIFFRLLFSFTSSPGLTFLTLVLLVCSIPCFT